MWARTPLCAIAVLALGAATVAPAVATPSVSEVPDRERAPSRHAPDAEIPHDGRPIVATVIEIDQAARTVTLDTPHGPVALAVTQEVVDSLSVGDIVVVSFTDGEAEDDYPSASPPLGGPAQRI